MSAFARFAGARFTGNLRVVFLIVVCIGVIAISVAISVVVVTVTSSRRRALSSYSDGQISLVGVFGEKEAIFTL